MSKKETALLIIDMQNDFVLEDAPFRIKGALGIVDNVRAVLEEFRSKNFPIFHMARVQRRDGSDIEITRKESFTKTPFALEGTKGAQIIDELKPKENEYRVKKIRMSAFFNTDLDSILRYLEIKNVVIIGVQTPNCIRTTAFDAVAYNYITYLVDDAVAGQSEEIHQANVLDMKNIGIKIIKTEQVKGLLK